MSKTEDLGLHGIYFVTLRAEFEQPTDYTKSTMQPFSKEYVFQIEMIDPCFSGVMDALIIDDMQRAVKQASTSQSLADVADDVSKTFGNQDGLTYCGPRIVELTTDPALYSSFLTFN